MFLLNISIYTILALPIKMNYEDFVNGDHTNILRVLLTEDNETIPTELKVLGIATIDMKRYYNVGEINIGLKISINVDNVLSVNIYGTVENTNNKNTKTYMGTFTPFWQTYVTNSNNMIFNKNKNHLIHNDNNETI